MKNSNLQNRFGKYALTKEEARNVKGGFFGEEDEAEDATKKCCWGAPCHKEGQYNGRPACYCDGKLAYVC